MFTSWTRHAKLSSGAADIDRTPNFKHDVSNSRVDLYLHEEPKAPNGKPKGRRLSEEVLRGFRHGSMCDTWTQDWQRNRPVDRKDEATDSHYRQGAMSYDLTHHAPPISYRPRYKGPASSGTAFSSGSYQVLLPQRSSPEDQSQPQIRFPSQDVNYPAWTMSVEIPASSSRRHEELRRCSERGPGSANLICDAHRNNQLQSQTHGIDKHPEIPNIMVDPYSSAAREFIATRQLLSLTRRRLCVTTQEPHVWIINYYGRGASKAVHSKVAPGSALALIDTASLGRQYCNQDPLRMSRLLGYHEADDPNSTEFKARLRFNRLIGKGGTSAVYSGGVEPPLENSMQETSVPAVAKILNPKHWKCALAELVASAAAFHRVSEGWWLRPERYHSHYDGSAATSPTSASGRHYHHHHRALVQSSADLHSPFVQGGAWLFPTELHLFWDFEKPANADWSSTRKKLDQISHPRFAQHELPSLCCLVLRNCADGVPLLTWLNTVYVKRRRKPSHEMCLYFAYTVVTLVRQLHSCGLIHGDIKPDNFVLLPADASYAGRDLFADVQVKHPLLRKTQSGLSPITLAGIDFGRSLDVKEALRDVIFVGDTQVSDFRCPSMLERSRWEAQIDLTGLAVTIFTMISLKYPKIRKKKAEAMIVPSLSVGEARGKVTHSYWFGSRIRSDTRQNEFWMGILDRLINFDPFHTSDGHTVLDSCLLLRQLESELTGAFELPAKASLAASYEVLYTELGDMLEFITDYQKKGGAAAGLPVMN